MQVAGVRPGPRRPARPVAAGATNRSPAGGTRCSGARSSRSSRRPRRSLPTCPGRSVSPSRSHRARKVGVPCAWPADAVVVASFGDASMNHSTARRRAQHRRVTQPTRACRCRCSLVCEDNGLGISVPTPTGWLGRDVRRPPGDPVRRRGRCGPGVASATSRPRPSTTCGASARRCCCTCRACGSSATPGPTRRPPTGRARRSVPTHARDPLLATARLLVGCGATQRRRRSSTATHAIAARVRAVAERGVAVPGRWRRRAEVMAPLAPRRPEAVAREVADRPSPRHGTGGADSRSRSRSTTRSPTLLEPYPQLVVFGEDVGAQGRRLRRDPRAGSKRFGAARVFDTLLDEQSDPRPRHSAPASAGLLPVPEIQYLAYLHNAEDQLRGEAASLQFFSRGAVPQPDGGAGRRLRLPEGVRRSLPQRQRARGAARHPGPGRRLRRPGRTTRPRCCARVLPPRRSTGRSACSSSRSRSTTSATCTPTATAAGWRPTRRADAQRSGRRGSHATATARDLTIVTLRQRRTDVPARRRPLAARGHRRTRARPALAGPAAGRRPAARGVGDRPGAGRRRDEGFRRGRRGRGDGARRARLHRRRGPGRGRRLASCRWAPPPTWCSSRRTRSSVPPARSPLADRRPVLRSSVQRWVRSTWS